LHLNSAEIVVIKGAYHKLARLRAYFCR